MQVYFTFVLPPPSPAGLISWSRLALALLDSLSLVATVLSGFTAWLVLEWHGWVRGEGDWLTALLFIYSEADTDINHWSEGEEKIILTNKVKYLQTENPGWALHITSTASEWIMFISFDIFLLTLWPDFSSLSLNIKCDNKQEIINQLWHKQSNDHWKTVCLLTRAGCGFHQEIALLKLSNAGEGWELASSS